jgi:hypothetical protein
MGTYLLAAVAAAIVIAFLLKRGGATPGTTKLVSQAVESGDAAPLLAAAEALSPPRRSLFFQEAIATLWEGFNRPLAIQLIKEFGRRHYAEKICQFWMKQALEVEPALAGKVLDREFLDNYYQPEVAACCGKTSS